MTRLEKETSYQKAYNHARECGLKESYAKSYAKTKTEEPAAIKHVQTTKGNLEYFIDWNVTEGGVVMLNPQTIKYYQKAKDTHPDADKYGVFFAFSKEQYKKGYNHLVELGFIKDGDIVLSTDCGAYGTKESLDAFFDFYLNRDKEIPTKCDPQEIYFYEYNNYESMYAWDGDKEAYQEIVDLWGEDIAKQIKRL